MLHHALEEEGVQLLHALAPDLHLHVAPPSRLKARQGGGEARRAATRLARRSAGGWKAVVGHLVAEEAEILPELKWLESSG